MISEITILSAFLHHKAFYLVFERPNFTYAYLYCYNLEDFQRTLLFGENFPARIAELRRQDPPCCIECHLPVEIEGGITYVDGKFEEFGITLAEANHYLQQVAVEIEPEFHIYLHEFPI